MQYEKSQVENQIKGNTLYMLEMFINLFLFLALITAGSKIIYLFVNKSILSKFYISDRLRMEIKYMIFAILLCLVILFQGIFFLILHFQTINI